MGNESSFPRHGAETPPPQGPDARLSLQGWQAEKANLLVVRGLILASALGIGQILPLWVVWSLFPPLDYMATFQISMEGRKKRGQ